MIRTQLLDGRALAAARQAALGPRVAQVQAKLGRPPGLGVVLVGDDAASALYVRNKARAAASVGLHSEICRLPADATAQQLLEAVHCFNEAARIDAFLLQLPLPAHLDKAAALAAVLPAKDADGLHPLNVAALMGGQTAPRPCTPLGCMALLAQAGVTLAGAHAVVVGRSAIVGQPLAQMLLEAQATVTVCHAQTRGLAQHVLQADVLVVATGKAHLVPGAWIKPGAVVLDVGISRVVDPTDSTGKPRLCGDVDFAGAQGRAGFLTPVPGGVGPMTIAMLLQNAVAAAEQTAAAAAAPPTAGPQGQILWT